MSGPYRINIVHFVNPHLIWVESNNNANGKKENEENELEQIGLFGVLPLLPQIDIIQNEIVSYRVDDWAPAITELMKKILRDAREITFEPIFTDPNNAIFDSISHKFGEITIKKRNGFFKFSEELNKTNFSMGDRPEFLRKLEAGELRSKLSKWETNNIIKSITSSSKTRDSKNLVFLKKCRDDDEIADDDTLSSSDKFATELTIDNVHKHNCLIDKMESPKMVPSESASMQLEEKLQMWKLAEAKDDLPSEYSVLVTEEKIEQDPLEKSKLYLLKKLHEYKEIKKNQQPNPQARQEKQKYEEPVKIPKFIPKYDLSVYTNRVYDLDSKLNRKIFTNNISLEETTNKTDMPESRVNNLVQNIKTGSNNKVNNVKDTYNRITKLINFKLNKSETTPNSEPPIADDDSDNETTISSLQKVLNLENSVATVTPTKIKKVINSDVAHANVFQNVDTNITKFIDKIINPVLIVHSKSNIRVQPVLELNNVYFTKNIISNLNHMSIEQPKLLQTVSWPCILRGYSMFMISPQESGKTLGYIPAVCRLISDCESSEGLGPLCIVVCPSAKSVVSVEKYFKRLLDRDRIVLSCFAGKDERDVATMLINGCDIFITTPCSLVRLLNYPDSVVDLRRLAITVLDGGERLDAVYAIELKYFLLKVKEMLRSRLNKEQNVQYVVASRVWCTFMEGLAKKAPHSVVSISAFEESVVYSKVHMSVSFVDSLGKTKAVVEFLKEIDGSKKSVIVCQKDEEVWDLCSVLKGLNYVVFAADSNMTVEDLYKLYDEWIQYEVPFIGAVIVCCDHNLTYLNITNASYLIHYALPSLFSTFRKRFAVLTDNYASIFKDVKSDVRIKILVEDTNTEQLPKILSFIKRCSSEVPEALLRISTEITLEKERNKAKCFVPICDKLLSFGKCENIWNCGERHSLFNEVDTPPEWMPTKGVVNFAILHFHNAVTYSVRLISHSLNGKLTNYPQTLTTLSLKIDMYYMNEVNKIPHGVPAMGDVCAVALTADHYERCQVLKVLTKYNNGNPKGLYVKLLDKQQCVKTTDTRLYYLPDKFKECVTYVALVKLSGLMPKDRDFAFSILAKHDLMKVVEIEHSLFMRGDVVLSVGNTIMVDNLEACQRIAKLNEVVVRYNFKEELLANHACLNENHLNKLKELCAECGFVLPGGKEDAVEEVFGEKLPEPQWAHLAEGELSLVYFACAETPDKFYIRLQKFEDCLQILTNDIRDYLKDNKPVEAVQLGEYVIAQFPDDEVYNRARIDEIVDDTKVKCFFVDHGDWRFVRINNIYKITEKFIDQLPFQAIECRLVGVKPFGGCWSEFSTNYFCDLCFVGNTNDLKELYVKSYIKEKAEGTGGKKYAIVMIDTSSDKDVVINQVMVKANLAVTIEDEIQYVEDFITKSIENSASEKESLSEIEEINHVEDIETKVVQEDSKANFFKYLTKKPIRSAPLVDDDFDDGDDDEWDLVFGSDGPAELASFLGLKPYLNSTNPEIEDGNARCTSELSSKSFQLISPPVCDEELDSDDLPALESSSNSTVSLKVHKPKLLWHQTKSNLVIKFEIVGIRDYKLDIKADGMVFFTKVDDRIYEFDIKFYGVVDLDKCTHNLKGMNVYIKLKKLINLKWATLCKDSGKERWICYNPDSIDTSSDEAEDDDNLNMDVLNNIVKNEYLDESDTDSCDAVDFKDDFKDL